MVYHGTYQNGVVVLDEKIGLAEGQRVLVDVAPASEQESTVWQDLLKLSGAIKGGPSDASVNHDHYLYGAPKREPEA
jgi:predicted DNA-binding antitoxin AbrB/MazE fold protein